MQFLCPEYRMNDEIVCHTIIITIITTPLLFSR